MTPHQGLIVRLLEELDKLADTFDSQGATSQGTQLNALLDDYYAAVEEMEASKCQ